MRTMKITILLFCVAKFYLVYVNLISHGADDIYVNKKFSLITAVLTSVPRLTWIHVHGDDSIAENPETVDVTSRFVAQ